ncbi:MAG: hypothetical protein OK455_05255 [Thaumarchaeota archaeon]|nr:hypothetical protein [Nitrososphaerota archaeon]
MFRPSFRGTAAIGSMLLGTSVVVYNMFEWNINGLYFGNSKNDVSFILSFYLAETIALFLLLLGFFLAYRVLRDKSSATDAAKLRPSSSLLSIIGSAIADRRLLRVAVVATLLYGLLYAVASSILVYQPSVDFASTYGVTSATWNYVPCCGVVGTMPELTLYLAPSAHLAVQIVPLSLLLLFIVPPLVGLNVAIALFSVRNTVAKLTGRWMVACGAAVGLFTACPTCAGLFLAESVGGIGATSLAVVLAPYQTLFIAVSIPLLAVMPFFFATRVRRAREAAARGASSFSVHFAKDIRLEAGNR